MWIGIASLAALALVVGLLIGVAATRLKTEEAPIVGEIEAMLPGSQCGQCGFPGCAQAASAMADGSVSPAACPPGGTVLAVKIAELLGVTLSADELASVEPRVAIIGEELCIGCTKCFQACPTDAIVGAPKQIHSVLPQYCTSCGLCVEACPTETVELVAQSDSLTTWTWPKPVAA